MPSLNDLLKFVCDCAAQSGHSFSEEVATELEKQIRMRYGSERIYVPPPGSRKDPARGDTIRTAAQTLPTGVVVQRYGVSRQLVHYHTRKRKNPDE